MDHIADIGIFGGSGFYSLLENAEEVKVKTPYGAPSDTIAVGMIGDKRVAFLPRHGKKHHLAPHMIPYRANIWAMKSIGVSRIIAPSAVGSLQPHIKPGHFVVCDQFVDRTSGRKDTFYDSSEIVHVSSAEPYCPDMRALASKVIAEHGIPVHDTGTNVVIQGPRFSSKAESKWFTSMGWEVISMTQYPEVILAVEQEMCYVNIALITDYDAGLVGEPGTEPVTADEVLKVLHANTENIKAVISDMVRQSSLSPSCGCSKSLQFAKF